MFGMDELYYIDCTGFVGNGKKEIIHYNSIYDLIYEIVNNQN